MDPQNPAVTLARQRWDKPHNVEKRIDALAQHVRRVVDTFPELSDAQRDRLRAAFRPALDQAAK